jgi:nucleoside-diphosphate-sugar epimerase
LRTKNRIENLIGVVGSQGQLGSHLNFILRERSIPISRKGFLSETPKTIIWAAGNANSRSSAAGAEREFKEFLTTLSQINFSKVEHVVVISSGGTVYGVHREGLVLESDGLDTRTPYSQLKFKIEEEFERLSIKYNFSLSILRLANVYSLRGKGLISSLMGTSDTRMPLMLLANPDSRKQYGHTIDYAQAIIGYIENVQQIAKIRRVLNLFSPHSYSIGEILSICSQHINLEIIGLQDSKSLPIESIELATEYPGAFQEPKEWDTLENFFEQNLGVEPR